MKQKKKIVKIRITLLKQFLHEIIIKKKNIDCLKVVSSHEG